MKNKALLAAAVAGIIGAAGTAHAKEKKAESKMAMTGGNDLVNCYGVNKCSGAGKCGGEGTSCAGTNKCKGMGWLPMPKDSCLAIEGGSLEPKKKS
jgi:uncharacterized membrane protein